LDDRREAQAEGGMRFQREGALLTPPAALYNHLYY